MIFVLLSIEESPPVKNSALHFNYSMEQVKINTSSPIDGEKGILNDNLRDILGFKQNLISGRSAESTSGLDRVILANNPLGF